MNLDLAIQRELKRSPMDSAMHGVTETMGAQDTPSRLCLKLYPLWMKCLG